VWLQFFKKQSGSATILALFVMLILGTSAGTYMVSAGTGLGNGHNYGDAISAQYAAESGVIYALTHAKQNTSKDKGKWDRKTLSSDFVALDSNSSASPKFKITITAIDKTARPTDLASFNGDYFKVTSIGKAGNTTRSIDAYITIPATDPPSPIRTFDLMTDAEFSGSKWTMGKDSSGTDFAAAPADNYYQVLFKDTIYANDAAHTRKIGNEDVRGFTLNYNVNLVSTNTGHPSDCGYGIYYLANGDPNNMSAYVLQYDPGLTPDQIVVKKVIASKNSTTTPWYNEVFGPNTNSFQQSMNQTKANKLSSPTWNNQTKTLTGVDPINNPTQDLMAVSMTDVLNKLNALKINGTTNNKMLGQNHTLTIDARPFIDPNDKTEKVVHTISMDGLEILKFIDRGKNGPVFTEGSTGLRVWQAKARFYNNINGEGATTGAIGSIKIRSWFKDRNN